jgi:hypothetical protein
MAVMKEQYNASSSILKLPPMSSLILLSYQFILLVVLIHHDITVESFSISKVHQPLLWSKSRSRRRTQRHSDQVSAAEFTEIAETKEETNVYEIPFPINDIKNGYEEEEILYDWFNHVVRFLCCY